MLATVTGLLAQRPFQTLSPNPSPVTNILAQFEDWIAAEMLLDALESGQILEAPPSVTKNNIPNTVAVGDPPSLP